MFLDCNGLKLVAPVAFKVILFLFGVSHCCSVCIHEAMCAVVQSIS